MHICQLVSIMCVHQFAGDEGWVDLEVDENTPKSMAIVFDNVNQKTEAR